MMRVDDARQHSPCHNPIIPMHRLLPTEHSVARFPIRTSPGVSTGRLSSLAGPLAAAPLARSRAARPRIRVVRERGMLRPRVPSEAVGAPRRLVQSAADARDVTMLRAAARQYSYNTQIHNQLVP